MRFNIYSTPHKGIRNALSQLMFKSCTLDNRNEVALKEFQSLANEIHQILDLHLKSEESVVIPDIEARVKGASLDNSKEHESILAFEKQVFNLISELKITSDFDEVGKVYSLLTRFISDYLHHMDEEETVLNKVVWENFTDEEIMAWHGRIMQSLKPEEIILWFKFIIPGVSPVEQEIILGGFKENAPVPFYEQVLGSLKSVVTGTDYKRIMAI